MCIRDSCVPTSPSAASGNVSGSETPGIPSPGMNPRCSPDPDISEAAQIRHLIIDEEFSPFTHWSSLVRSIFPSSLGTTETDPPGKSLGSRGPKYEFRNTASAATSEWG